MIFSFFYNQPVSTFIKVKINIRFKEFNISTTAETVERLVSIMKRIKKIYMTIIVGLLYLTSFAVTSSLAQKALTETKLTASDGAMINQFGDSVAISGYTAVIGAPRDNDSGTNSGSSYVFVRDSQTGLWREQAKLLPSDGVASDWFGESVAISGDTAIVGAFRDDDSGSDSGSAYVFVRDPQTGSWREQAKLLPSDGATGDWFGLSVAISGNTAIVGAYRDDDSGSDSGSAYVFVHDPQTGSWREQTKLLPSDGATGDWFGLSVAISGNTAIVGAFKDDDSDSDSGSAYVFVHDPHIGIWREQAKLLASDGAAGDWFGKSVAISGDTAVIGAFKDDDSGSDSGSSYVFVRDPQTGIWREQAKLLASDGAAGDWFSWSVAISGDTAVIGASKDDDSGSGSGSAYVFERDPLTGSWSKLAKLLASDGAAGDWFGESAKISGNFVIIGATFDDDLGMNSGSTYIYEQEKADRLPVDILGDLINAINDLKDSDFKNRNMRKALTNKINATLEKINQGLYQGALDKLQNDVLGKTDGCGGDLINGGPDKNDWITNCSAQNQVYSLILEVIDL